MSKAFALLAKPIDAAARALEAFAKLPRGVQTALVLLVPALKLGEQGFGALGRGMQQTDKVKSVISNFGNLGIAVQALKGSGGSGLVGLAGKFSSIAGLAGQFGKAIAAIPAPVLAVVAAIAAVVVAITAWVKTTRSGQQTWNNLTKSLNSFMRDTGRGLVQAWNNIKAAMKPITDLLGPMVKQLGQFIKEAWNSKAVALVFGGTLKTLGLALVVVVGGFRVTIDVIAIFIRSIITAGLAIKDFLTGKWDFRDARKEFDGVKQSAKDIGKAWGDTGKAMQGIWGPTAKAARKSNKSIQNSSTEAHRKSIAAWNGTARHFEFIATGILRPFNAIKGKIASAFASARKGGQNAWNGISGWASRTSSNIGNGFRGLPGHISSFFGSASSSAQRVFGPAIGFFRSVPGRIGGFFRNIPGIIQGIFSGAGGWLQSAGESIMQGFVSAAQSAWNGVKGFFSRIGDWIKAHKGPLDYDRQLLVPAGNAIMTGFS